MLTLPIVGKWFYMILSGEKKEEYRELKPYYTSRFKKIFDMYPYSNIPSGGDKREIRFRNGYGSSRPEFIALCTLDIKTGREEWGAEPGKEYYTLKIHEITHSFKRQQVTFMYEINNTKVLQLVEWEAVKHGK